MRLQQREQKGLLGHWLLRLGFVEPWQITLALSRQYGMPIMNLKASDAKAGAANMVPAGVARCANLLPVGYDSEKDALHIAVAGPVHFDSHEAIRRMLGKGISAYIGDETVISTLLTRWYEVKAEDPADVPAFQCLEDVKQITRDIVERAVRQRADVIQAELPEDFLWIRVDSAHRHEDFVYRRLTKDECRLETEETIGIGI